MTPKEAAEIVREKCAQLCDREAAAHEKVANSEANDDLRSHARLCAAINRNRALAIRCMYLPDDLFLWSRTKPAETK